LEYNMYTLGQFSIRQNRHKTYSEMPKLHCKTMSSAHLY